MTANAGVKKLIRNRMAYAEETYSKAAEKVESIREVMAEMDLDFEDAQDYVDDPANQVMCRTCGWTYGMICPECLPGCGCNPHGCTGYRHDGGGNDFEDDPDDDDCDCGGSLPYDCVCR